MELTNQSNPRPKVGSMMIGSPLPDTEGIWRKMDGIDNLDPGSGIDYRVNPKTVRGTPGPAIYFERVA